MRNKLDKFPEFIFRIMSAMSYIALYAKDHAALSELLENAIALLNDLYVDDRFSITVLGTNLLFNDSTVTEKGIHLENFRKRLRVKGVEKIIFIKGVSADEIRGFMYKMASKDETPVSSEHLLVGALQVKLKSPESGALEMMDKNISRVKDVYNEFSRFKELDVFGLEDAIVGFILALKTESNVLRMISPIKSFSEYTYVHAANVSILTIFQAESLGLSGEALYDIGLAGLLHDMGKMFISKDILNKNTKLDETEWSEVKRHPILGAMYLSKLDKIPKVAVIAAFEHHMKFDGTGYPDTHRRGKKQHIVSQLVAIADFFDAMRTERPYRKTVDLQAIVLLLKETAGKDFNPLLINNFLKALNRIGAFGEAAFE